MKLTVAEAHALRRLVELTDARDNEWWKTMFIGTNSASTMRRSLAPRGLVEIRKQNNGYRYRITPAGRSILDGGRDDR